MGHGPGKSPLNSAVDPAKGQIIAMGIFFYIFFQYLTLLEVWRSAEGHSSCGMVIFSKYAIWFCSS